MIRYKLFRALQAAPLGENAEYRRAAPAHGHRLSAKLHQTLLEFRKLRMPRENDLFKIILGLRDTLGDTPIPASPNLSLETNEFIL